MTTHPTVTTGSTAATTTAAAASTLPDKVLRKFQKGKPLKFPLNEEATSLAMSPTGRFLCAGFTDGTVRLFDLTGHFKHGPPKTKSHKQGKQQGDGSAAAAVAAATSTSTTATTTTTAPRSCVVVDSKRHQRYGAVACQIHAKGVHTSLRMHVELSPDGLWCFAGVLRGSMELLAIYLGDLQDAYNAQQQEPKQGSHGNKAADDDNLDDHDASEEGNNLLDHLTVYRYSDAKLRGFGACTNLKNSNRYLLASGKSIKNIHIWSFTPRGHPEEPVLTQIYDASTNGNTIRFLQFRRHATTGALQAISKSDGARLRVWDLTSEEDGVYDNDAADPNPRPSRPPFQDVPNTEATLAVVGGFCVCGGSNMYNQTSLVSLNVENLRSPYNHTEMALPGISVSPTGSSRRMQRGDLKSVQAAFGSVESAKHVLLEISDDTLAHYRSGHPTLQLMEKLPWYPDMARTMTIGELPGGIAVASVALYQATSGRGQVSVWALEDVPHKEKPAAAKTTSVAKTSKDSPAAPTTSPQVGSLEKIAAESKAESRKDPVSTNKPKRSMPEGKAVQPVAASVAPKNGADRSTTKITTKPAEFTTRRKESTPAASNRKSTVARKSAPPSSTPMNEDSISRRPSVTTAPKPRGRQPLITPTPATKIDATPLEPWQHLSLDSAAKALSSMKHSPLSRMTMVNTPSVRGATNQAVTPAAAIDTLASTDQSSLPAPRILNAANQSQVETRRTAKVKTNQNLDTSRPSSRASSVAPVTGRGCVTPVNTGSKRKFPDPSRSDARKRSKASRFDWLRFNVTVRGRRDDQIMRTAIAEECKRLRKAIERKVDTLPHRRASPLLDRTEKLKAEHQAAFRFLEKKVWRSVRSLLQSLERSPSIGALRESEALLHQLLRDYKATAANMKSRHDMELASQLPGIDSDPPSTSDSPGFDASLFDEILENLF